MNTKVLCAILLSAGLAGLTGRADAGEYLKSYSVVGRANVQVRATNATVSVTTSDDAKVQFDAKYNPPDWWWTPAVHISSRQDGNVVRLDATSGLRSWWDWGRFGSQRVAVEVRMPRNADLQLQTSNGAIDVSSLNGNIRIHTSNGRVRVRKLSGMIDVRSSNGAIILEAIDGALDAGTSNGSIDATGVDGDCQLASSNGHIRASGRFGALDIRSSNGSVTVQAESGSRMTSDWHIRTSNARVDLSVPTDFKANLDASTTHGQVSSNLPLIVRGNLGNSRLGGALNGGGHELAIHTTNGSIHIQ